MSNQAGFVVCMGPGRRPAPRMSLTSIKVCGVTSQRDASMVCHAFREEVPESCELLLGMILWPGSKRSVDADTARSISRTARRHGVLAVGVFVDESTDQIAATCEDLGVSVAQLHGRACRDAVRRTPLPSGISTVEVVDVTADGSVVGSEAENGRDLGALWKLYDSKGGGSGRAFDWSSFVPPHGKWFLGGGLSPENVEDAVSTLRPSGLDVASGVTAIDGCAKDEQRLRRFLRRAWAASESLSAAVV